MTLLELVNRVMRRLREDQVGDFSAEYTKLVVELISDIHQEILDIHDWSSMDVDTETALVAGQREYAVANTTAESMYRGIVGTKSFIDATSPQGQNVIVVHKDAIEDMYQQNRDQTQAQPLYVAYYPDFEAGVTNMVVWPTPDTNDVYVRQRFHVPETTVDTSTSISYEFKCPLAPLRLGALYIALNERGEELGEPGGLVEKRYYAALSAAKEADVKSREDGNEYEFYRE